MTTVLAHSPCSMSVIIFQSNSKRLASSDWKPRTKKQVADQGKQTQDQEQTVVTPVITQEAAGMSNVPPVQHSCVVCHMLCNSDEELQHHMMSHVKQTETTYVISNIVQGNPESVDCGAGMKDLNTQPMYQQIIPVENSGDICTMCSIVVLEPGGLKEHLQTVHQLQ